MSNNGSVYANDENVTCFTHGRCYYENMNNYMLA